MHHCDWVATLVGAAGGKLDDTTDPPQDGINLWSTLADPSITSGGPRTEVVMNVDPTNQNQTNDPGGWSGYAGIRVGDFKLVLGWPGVPDDWCWPNQNQTGSLACASTRSTSTKADEERAPDSCRASRGEGSTALVYGMDLGTTAFVEEHASPCGALQACCLRGEQNPDLHSFAAADASDCCAPCIGVTQCTGFTFNMAEKRCFLKKATGHCYPSANCTSAVIPGRSITNCKLKWRNIWIRDVFCYRAPAPKVLGSQSKQVSNPA